MSLQRVTLARACVVFFVRALFVRVAIALQRVTLARRVACVVALHFTQRACVVCCVATRASLRVACVQVDHALRVPVFIYATVKCIERAAIADSQVATLARACVVVRVR